MPMASGTRHGPHEILAIFFFICAESKIPLSVRDFGARREWRFILLESALLCPALVRWPQAVGIDQHVFVLWISTLFLALVTQPAYRQIGGRSPFLYTRQRGSRQTRCFAIVTAGSVLAQDAIVRCNTTLRVEPGANPPARTAPPPDGRLTLLGVTLQQSYYQFKLRTEKMGNSSIVIWPRLLVSL
jgi:hypothetical protein